MHRDLPTAWTLTSISKKSQTHLRWHIQTTSPTPTPSSPGSIPCLPSKTHSLSGSPAWVALPFPAPVHPRHRSEPPESSPGPHAQFTDVRLRLREGWLPWVTHVTGGRRSSLVTKQCLNLPPAHSTCHGASWSVTPTSLEKPCWRPDLALGLSKECPTRPLRSSAGLL